MSFDHTAPPVKAKGVVHKLLAQTAKEMARCWYEEAAHDNDFYREHPNIHLFVDRRWGNFIRHARSALTDMLAMPNVPENQKAEIYDALLLNGAVNAAINSPLH